MKLPLYATILLSCMTTFAWADAPAQGDSYRDAPLREQAEGSAASFDKRLPPVIPGEEIQDGNKKIKAWSTSGGVSVSEPPHAPEIPNTQPPLKDSTGRIGVVVDGREFLQPSRQPKPRAR